MTKTAVIYHYYEKDSSYRDNLLHFLSFGYSKAIDYFIVIAGGHSVNLPTAENISYALTENLNNDFGGYCYAINKMVDISKYEFFFFINSSIRGPFIATRGKKEWTEYFIEQLQSDIGIVGSTINILPPNSTCAISYAEKYGQSVSYSHVQTTSYLLPKKTLLCLIKEGFYNSTGILVKEDAIRDYELRLSQLIKSWGWNLKCLLPEYNNIDYRITHEDINPTSEHGDPCFKDSYFGRTIHPSEIIFTKTNREMYSFAYFDRLAYSLCSASQSEDQLLNNSDLDRYYKKINLVQFSTDRLSYVPLGKAFKALMKKFFRHLRGRSPIK